MVRVSQSMRFRRLLSVLLTMLIPAAMLSFAACGRAQTLGPDVYSGLSWGDIAYYVGGGPDPFMNGTLGTNVANPFAAIALGVDSQGNIYFGSGGQLFVEYMGTYTSGAKIPALLAMVTTKATPATTPVTHGVYAVAGVSDPDSACENLGQQAFCADAATALEATFGQFVSITFDKNDNLYTVDGSNVSAVRRIDATTTAVTTVAGQLNCITGGTSSNFNCPTNYPSGAPFGDGGPATAATLYEPNDLRIDSGGNIYIADSFNGVVRVVYEGVTTPPLLTAALASQGVTLNSSDIGNIYTIAGAFQTYCFAAGACGDNGPALSAGLYPQSLEIDSAGNLYISDTIAYTLHLVYAGGPEPPLLRPVISQQIPLQVGNFYLIAGTETVPCSAAPCGDGGGALAAQLTATSLHVDTSGNLYFGDFTDLAVRKIDAAGYISAVAGVENPGNASGNAGSVVVGGAATDAQFSAVAAIAIDQSNNLYIADSMEVWTTPPAAAQTIGNFPATSTGTYGQTVTLDAVAENSAGAANGSAITYSYTVNGGTPIALTGTSLVLPGAGSVVISAMAAGGVENNVVYAPATATQTITVDKATLTITADDKSALYNQPIPPLTASYTGFVNGDTSNSLTGTPMLSDGGTVQGANAGTYVITAAAGTLSSSNYTFIFVAGSLHITGATAQTITFNPLPNITYGQAQTITLAAILSPATPSRDVTYTLGSGDPATISGSTLTITAGGTITITANQFGNNTFSQATAAQGSSLTQSFTVNPAPLTVAGPSVVLPYNTAIDPASFPAPMITGFATGDTSALVTGSATYTTPATGTPNAGSSFPINVALNTLTLVPSAAKSYIFVTPATAGTLTIVPAPQTLIVPQLNALVYGSTDTVAATSVDSKGNATSLPIMVTSTSPGAFQFAGGFAPTVTVGPNIAAMLEGIGVGTTTVTFTQPGSGNYAAATSVTQTIAIAPAPLQVVANSFTREFGAANPALTYYISCLPDDAGCTARFVNGDADVPSVITGVPTVSVSADATTAPGTYPIVVSAGTLSAPNYTLVPVNGTLTITPAGSYTITPSTPTLTIAAGHAGQLTLTVTPTNYYQGTITMSCGTLPANVTCIFSPASYTFTGATNIAGGVYPAQGTLTINTLGGQPVVGAISRPGSTAFAAAFLLPGALATLLIGFRRRRCFKGRDSLWQVGLLLLLGAGALHLSACGGSSAGTPVAAAGTINLTITGTGTAAAGTGNVVQTLNVNVVIQ